MYAVIFRAEINEVDEAYFETAARLRARARQEYGCLEFNAVTEGRYEIAVSYWESEEQIRKWKQDSEHLAAQGLGRSKWYKSYSVQVVRVMREYESEG
jgi:heme-degrading monooxygenase HmoA